LNWRVPLSPWAKPSRGVRPSRWKFLSRRSISRTPVVAVAVAIAIPSSLVPSLVHRFPHNFHKRSVTYDGWGNPTEVFRLRPELLDVSLTRRVALGGQVPNPSGRFSPPSGCESGSRWLRRSIGVGEKVLNGWATLGRPIHIWPPARLTTTLFLPHLCFVKLCASNGGSAILRDDGELTN
jgi:hypothetical protein